MKLKTKLMIAFLTIIIIPIMLSGAFIYITGRLQVSAIEQNYEITGAKVGVLSNSIQILSNMTEKNLEGLRKTADQTPEKLSDYKYLSELNDRLVQKKAYLAVRKGRSFTYIGTEEENVDEVIQLLPQFEEIRFDGEGGIYLGGDRQVLVKQVNFTFPDKNPGSAYIITNVSKAIPEMEEFVTDVMVAVVLILVFTAVLLVFWIYRGIIGPLGKMKDAAHNIKEGNLDFELKAETDDELGQLTQDLEDMRKRLKVNAQEKLEYDQESKELISNISHDLKTPVTSIKGYAEGIMDGVADTPEKMDKYIRTIYNKANEMNRLINELTLYAQIDTNRIPYNYSILSVSRCFNDCAEDLSLDLEARGIDFCYYNYVPDDARIIADPEQIQRVIQNIINNSEKYRRSEKPRINLRVKDMNDFIQVEIEDNGRGIAARDLPNVFDRFYRTDASRNSSRGGSGIGLSIVKKIIEDHGGRIWATSKEGMGTTMCFALRKYQEADNNG